MLAQVPTAIRSQGVIAGSLSRWAFRRKGGSSCKAQTLWSSFSLPLRCNPGSASSQFRDVSLPAFLKPEPFPPRHVSLEVFPLSFLFLFFFPLLLPPFLPCFRGALPQDGMQGCRPALELQPIRQQPQRCKEMTGWSCSVDG